MLKQIKSLNIIKLIFKRIHDKRKLELINYNKRIQNQINISLYNYRIYSRKFIIFEKNGNIREYYSGELIFEGKYLSGKRNGKGREYNKVGL